MAIVLDGVGTVNGVTLPTTGFGKVLQVIRATDTTNRSTTSASFVDVTGMSVTITPQLSTSALMIIAVYTSAPDGSTYLNTRLTDASNVALSGAESDVYGNNSNLFRTAGLTWGYVTPGTTSAVTYKLRFASTVSGQNVIIQNSIKTGQMYAIEVAA